MPPLGSHTGPQPCNLPRQEARERPESSQAAPPTPSAPHCPGGAGASRRSPQQPPLPAVPTEGRSLPGAGEQGRPQSPGECVCAPGSSRAGHVLVRTPASLGGRLCPGWGQETSALPLSGGASFGPRPGRASKPVRGPRPASACAPLAHSKSGAAGTQPPGLTLDTVSGSQCSRPPFRVKPQGAPPCSCTGTYWKDPGRLSILGSLGRRRAAAPRGYVASAPSGSTTIARQRRATPHRPAPPTLRTGDSRAASSPRRK